MGQISKCFNCLYEKSLLELLFLSVFIILCDQCDFVTHRLIAFKILFKYQWKLSEVPANIFSNYLSSIIGFFLFLSFSSRGSWAVQKWLLIFFDILATLCHTFWFCFKQLIAVSRSSPLSTYRNRFKQSTWQVQQILHSHYTKPLTQYFRSQY